MLWTNEYLNRLALEAEIDIAKETKCIIDRISIETEAGTAGYQLPEYVNNIRKVLWRGFRLDPVGQIEYEDWIYSLGSQTQGAFDGGAFDNVAYDTGNHATLTPQAKPLRYFYSTFGENVIHFNPNVHESISADQNELWGSAIADRVIVEFYRMPDGDIYKIPEYIRRRTIKSYVLWKAFQREGDGQNLQAAEYHRNRYVIQLRKALSIVNGVYRAAISSRSDKAGGDCICESDYGYQGPYKPARPVLPSNYGCVVEDYD